MRNFVQTNPCWLVLKTTQMGITLILTANQFIFDGSWNKVVANNIWFTACIGQILEIVVRLAIIKVCIHWILNIHVALLQSEVMLFLCVQPLCHDSFMICTMFIKEFYILFFIYKNQPYCFSCAKYWVYLFCAALMGAT